MRVLLDENVPHPLRKFILHHTVGIVRDEGWKGIKNGDLLRLMEGRYDVFVLGDKNLRYQRDLTGHSVAPVELPTNRWPLLGPLIPRIVEAINAANPGSYTVVELQGAP